MTTNGRSDHPEPYSHGKDFGFCSKSDGKSLEDVEQTEKSHSGFPVQTRQRDCKGRSKRELLPSHRQEVASLD